MLNEQIKNYLLLEKIGEGGMATVYKAQHKDLRSIVAVKVLKLDFVHNRDIRSRFLDEPRKMARLQHPNIVRVTDMIDAGDVVAFVMEYVEGETLKQYLDRKGKLTDEEIKNIFEQMLDAVDYVHDNQLIHRDIKPSNFMIDRNGKVKLMDFGIARTNDPSDANYTQTGTGILMGTPTYMSPEQVRADKTVDFRSDIYSLGVTLYYMTLGEAPYNPNTESQFDIFNKIVFSPLPHLEKTQPFNALIEKACQKDKEKRFQSCKEWLQVLIKSNSTTVEQQEKVTPLVPIEGNGFFNKQLFDPIALASIVGSFLIVFFVWLISVYTTKTNIPTEPFPIEWVDIPAGEFIMGSPESEFGRDKDEMQHKVNLSAFKMSKYEVTFAQYDAFCEATGRSKPDDYGKGRDNHPVINVSWHDAKAFAEWMGCRLPTEAEWEYACRAGTTTPFHTGNNLTTTQANYNGNFPYFNNHSGIYREKTLPVGSFAPNDWGLYDMHGNVSEWCNDRYDKEYYANSPKNNPLGPSSGSSRVLRGGSWYHHATVIRSAVRTINFADERSSYTGFRVVLSQ